MRQKYTGNLGCRYRGIPHDLHIIFQNMKIKIEVCHICNKKFRFNKGYRGRVDNAEYLKAHLRQYAQRGGLTKRVYHKIYSPSELTIKI